MPTLTRGFRGRRGNDSAGPTPEVSLDTWKFTITSETGREWSWTWRQLLALPSQTPTVDLHCVTRWSKLGTRWRAVAIEPLAPTHGGPARLLVPHLYLWKSAKWVCGLRLMLGDEPGFWEGLGYHMYGDPWREQRYDGD